MVNKKLVAESILPYGAEADLTDEETDQILNGFFEQEGFKDADALVFHGGPSLDEELRRIKLFDSTAEYINSLGGDPDTYFPEDKTELLDHTGLESSEINYINPDITEDDISQSGNPDKSIHVSSDYHQEGIDWLLNQYDDRDYLVLGAETSNEDITHWPIVGGTYTSKAGAEMKEAARKKLGSRF